MTEHRLGVSENYLVKRKLVLDAHTNQDVQPAIAEIDKLYGLDKVDYDTEKCVLKLAYDGTRLDIEQIEAILEVHQITLKKGWWQKRRLKQYRFVDQNIRDNQKREPWCCH
ncbi:hypothetical protein [Gynuella sunshinyii]|uniref:Cation transport ATPase n=1 Tax=Gynuella sunshinyii YC6258 TaxID=1445510 RepID=A0A0C5W4A2_9GAMM|nr:hypothetical protein [Gynuella sunshinyii]AJQ97454.1 hypothetical Protein YC6258_05424 [Gynuella sunshinyii YC6258]